jgi:predicted esterase
MPYVEDARLLRHATAPVQGRYLVRPPRGAARHHFIGFHGYAQNAEAMFDAFAGSVPGDEWLVVSVQALHPFYAGREQLVVASWMTRLDRERAIASNVAYVDAVVEALDAEFGAPGLRVFAGFSQGTGMAYRAAALGRHRADLVVALGGDVPPELAATPPRPWPPVLALAGTTDPHLSPERLARDVDALRAHGTDARAHVFEGGHEWSAAARAVIAAALRERADAAR